MVGQSATSKPALQKDSRDPADLVGAGGVALPGSRGCPRRKDAVVFCRNARGI